MTVPSSIDPAQFLHEHLAQASPDLLREMLATFVNTLLSAEADTVCGAAYGALSPERVNQRNGYRYRDFDTRAGTLDVAIPKLRTGTYFPEWLLERRRRAESALTSVVATCYLLGVSTRRMDKLVQSLGITGLSRSQVSIRPPTSTSTWSPSASVHWMPALHVRGRRCAHYEGARGRAGGHGRVRGRVAGLLPRYLPATSCTYRVGPPGDLRVPAAPARTVKSLHRVRKTHAWEPRTTSRTPPRASP